MAKKRRSRVNLSKLRGMLFLLVSIGIMFSLISKFNQVIVKANDNIKNLKVQQMKVVKEEEDLREKLELLDNEDYVTTYARENYVFKADNETVVKISHNGDVED